jgi:hypothetical protein
MSRKDYGMMLTIGLLSGLLGGFVSTAFFAGQPVFAQKSQEHETILRAERFELVDVNGMTRARLELGPDVTEETLRSMLKPVLPQETEASAEDTSPRLVFSDKEGTPLAKLDLHGLYLYDKKPGSLPRAQLSVDTDGSPNLELKSETYRAQFTKSAAGIEGLIIYDQQGMARTGLGLSPDGRPALALLGEKGIVRAGLGLFPKAKPGLFFYDAEGKGRTVLGLTDHGEPVLSFYDTDFRHRALMTLGPVEGEPSISFYGKDSSLLAVLGSTELEKTYRKSIEARSPSSLLLFDQKENVIWSAP